MSEELIPLTLVGKGTACWVYVGGWVEKQQLFYNVIMLCSFERILVILKKAIFLAKNRPARFGWMHKTRKIKKNYRETRRSPKII